MKKDYYSNKYLSWEWLLDTKNEYLRSLPSVDTSNLNLNNEVYIGVYGPTQVGKTTFILNLLGIRESKILELSKALRGKQDIGKSATVTATIFKKSKDKSFYVLKPDNNNNKIEKKITTPSELEDELKQIRKDITSGNLFSLEEIIIYIPINYFKSAKRNSNELSIVDLPGDDTKDSNEENHVDDILKKYIILCKSVIIMELSSNITSLSQIGIESIQNWYKFRNKFVVVITRAISDDSVRKLVLNGQIKSQKDLRGHYFKEITRIIRKKYKYEIKNKIIPLELGKSLDSLKSKNSKELYNKASSWNEKLLEQLNDFLKSNNLPESQIKELFYLTESLEEIHEEKRNKIVNDEKKINNKLKNYENQKRNIEKTIYEDNINTIGLKSIISKIEYNIKLLDLIYEEGIFKFDYDSVKRNELIKDGKDQDTINHWENLLINFTEDLTFEGKKEKYKSVNEKFNHYLRTVNKDTKTSLIKFEKQLNDIFDIDYHFKFLRTSKIIESETEMRNITAKTSKILKNVKEDPYYLPIKRLKEKLSEAIKTDIKYQRKRVNEIYISFIAILQNNVKELEKIKTKVDNEKVELELLKLNEEKAKVKFKKEIEASKQLDIVLIESYKKEMLLLKAQFNQIEDENIKISKLVEMNVITNQIERLVKYGSENS